MNFAMRRGPTVSLLLAMLLVVGCGAGPFPGGRLDGPETSLSALDKTSLEPVSVVLLETRSAAPYSVRVQLFQVDGALYLDPAPQRRWLKFMSADPAVRVRFPDDPTIYRARAVMEANPQVLGQFDEGVVVVRLDPG